MLIKKRIFTIILSSLFLCMFLSCSPVFAQDNNTTAERLSGSDRYETSVAISKDGWVQANTVIIASGLNYPDALSAAALSKLKDAPILLTEKDALEPVTIAELKRLKATQAFIIGGTGVIGSGVEEQLRGLGIGITRIGGTDRYDTSEKVAELVGANNGIVVASASNFPDALSIAPIAGIKGMPILLSPKDYLNPNIAAFINGKSIPVSYIVGGTGVLASTIDSSVPNSKRLSGADRYATNLNINNQFAGDLKFNTIYLASAKDFPDALCGAALAAKNNAPIFLINKDSISDATISFIKSKNVQHIVILGGSGSVSQSVESTVNDIIRNSVVHPTSVSLNKTSDALTVGGTDILTASITPNNATNQAVTWASSNNSIATVDSTGNVTAVGAGTATITVTTADENITTSCAVTVTNPIVHPTAVSLSKTSDSLTVGGTDTLTVSITPNNVTNQAVTWASSNNSIATVDSTGNVTAVSAGTATITVTTADGSITTSCAVTVTNPTVYPTAVSLNKTSDSLTVGGTDALTASITPNNATNQAMAWTSSDNSIATVDSTGNVTAVSAGIATITVTTADESVTTSCAITTFNPGPGHMLISSSLVNFTASYEGYSGNPYVGADSQNSTIGYGHVILSGENYTYLTKTQAWNLLMKDLQNTANGVNSLTSNINLSQQQFDALVDFSYNCGITSLQNSTLFKDINAGASADKLKTDFQMWSYCNGTPLTGLYRRRTDEWQIYTSGNYTRDYPSAPDGYM